MACLLCGTGTAQCARRLLIPIVVLFVVSQCPFLSLADRRVVIQTLLGGSAEADADTEAFGVYVCSMTADRHVVLA